MTTSYCENCGREFKPKQAGYINGFSADIMCDDCCDKDNEEQFELNERKRCGD
jgi:hypothetical protein